MTEPTGFSQDVLTVISALKGVTLLGTMSSGTIMLLSMVSFWEHRKEFTFRHPSKRWRLPLILTATVSFIVLSFDCSTVWRSWSSPEEDVACKVVSTLIPLGYIIEKQCLNLFLYDRAKIVHSAISLGAQKDWYLKLLRWLLFLTLTVGMPVLFYWAPFAAFTGRIAPEGDCVFFTVLPQVPVAFAVADTFLSVGMLLIFLAPLLSHSTGMKQLAKANVKSNASFDRMIRHNIILSCCATSFGLMGLIGLATFNWLSDGTRATAHYPSWGLFIITWDNFLSVVAVHCMTPNWLPKVLLKMIGRSQAGTATAPGNSASHPVSSPLMDKRRIVDDIDNSKESDSAFALMPASGTTDV